MAVFALAVLVRIPTLSLPVEGDAAALATRGGRMGHEVAFRLAEAHARGPLLPMLLAVPTASGAGSTQALRGLDVLLAGLLCALVLAVAGRVGLDPREAFFAAALTAVHPLLLVHVGGAVAGTASLVGVLWLLALLLLQGARGPGRRRLGAACAVLLPLADPLAAVLAAAALVLYLRGEGSGRARAVVLGAFAGILVLTPWPSGAGDASLGQRVLALAVGWLPLAALLVFLPWVLRGARALLAGPARALVLAALASGGATVLLAVLLPLEGGPAFSAGAGRLLAPLVPWVVLAGVRGWRSRPAAWRRRAARIALAGAVAGALLAVGGPLQVFVRPGGPAAAGRLWRLGRAVRAAGEAAGPDGWVAIDLDHDLAPLDVERLGDLVPAHRCGPLPRHAPDAGRGPALPLADLPAGAALGVLTRYRPEVLEVVTFGGVGIWSQRPTARFGPWLVLRASRP